MRVVSIPNSISALVSQGILHILLILDDFGTKMTIKYVEIG